MDINKLELARTPLATVKPQDCHKTQPNGKFFVSVQSGLLLIDSEGSSVSLKAFSFRGPGILIWVHPRLIDFSVVTTLRRESSPLSVKIAGNPSLEEPKLKIVV